MVENLSSKKIYKFWTLESFIVILLQIENVKQKHQESLTKAQPSPS